MSSEKIIVLLSAEKNNSPLERWKQTILPLSAEKKQFSFWALKKNSRFGRWKKPFSSWALRTQFSSWALKKIVFLLRAEKNSSPFERWKNQFSWELKKILLLSAEKEPFSSSAQRWNKNNSPLDR